jgi:regulator of sigma D
MRKAKLRKKISRAIASGNFKLSRRERWQFLMRKAANVFINDETLTPNHAKELANFCEFLEMSNAYADLTTDALHKMETRTDITTKVVSSVFVNHPDDAVSWYKRHIAVAYYKIVGQNPTKFYMPTRASHTLGDYFPEKYWRLVAKRG